MSTDALSEAQLTFRRSRGFKELIHTVRTREARRRMLKERTANAALNAIAVYRRKHPITTGDAAKRQAHSVRQHLQLRCMDRVSGLQTMSWVEVACLTIQFSQRSQ